VRISHWLILVSIVIQAAMMTPNIWIIPALAFNAVILYGATEVARRGK
jgi:hypothetical protein